MTTQSKPRYLTKSRYKLALECPTKLFYTNKPAQFLDSKLDDPFLQALAKGGFQVGALAQCLYAGGMEVTSKNHEQALAKTAELMQANDAVIYEAAFRHGHLFVRVDVLIKSGSSLKLLEVKAKSFDPDASDPFVSKRDTKKLKAEYAPYLYDIAFQTHVVRLATGMEVLPRLVLANKRAQAPVDGLNQLFLLKRTDHSGSHVVIKRVPTKREIGELLIEVDVNHEVSVIIAGENTDRSRHQGNSFADEVNFFADHYVKDQRIPVSPGAQCKHCEYRTKPGESRSGFRTCWTTEGRLKGTQVDEPFVFDIWSLHHTKTDAIIADGKPLMSDVTQEDLATRSRTREDSDTEGLTPQERQWLQVESVGRRNKNQHIDRSGISRALSAWQFPLHFIDFETASTAIPFNRGMRPYEALAFQFSHHVVHQDGRLEHAGEYLHRDVGEFPNFAFVRQLKEALDKDNGTIFRYAAHENTILCRIRSQLAVSSAPDREELMSWIETVTHSPRSSAASGFDQWEGSRSMVDLRDIVKKYLYLPEMGGSISIKRVLPAILNQKTAFRERYSQPIYGSKAGIKSLNFRDWSWIKYDIDGQVVDPYTLLEPVFQNVDIEKLDLLTADDEELADGGAAMTAYAMMQFTEMTTPEREALCLALLRYCELDTFAMVLLYEYLREVARGNQQVDHVA